MSYNLSTTWTVVLIVLAAWELAWKSVALWKSGRNNHLGWFIALLLVNSVGILPIYYLATHLHGDEVKVGLDYEEASLSVKG